MFAYHRLFSCVTEHLTAEIVQLSVSDITKAIEWMKYSFLYVRMKKVHDQGFLLDLSRSFSYPVILFPLQHEQNPKNYGVKVGISGDRLEKHVQGTIVII